MSQALASRPAGRRQECTIGQLHPKSSTVQQQQQQQSVIQPDVVAHRQQLDDNKTQQQQLIAGGQKSALLSRQQSVDKIQSSGDGHSSYQTDKADCWNSERLTMSQMSKTARTTHRLSRRHSSATILPQTGETTQFQSQQLQQQQLVTTGSGFQSSSRLRERSSSTRASSSGRCRLGAVQYEQQQQHEDKVHRLNVPGQAGQYNRTKNSRSAEQLERLQLLLLAPQPQSHRHRQLSGDKMVGQHQPVQQTSGRLTAVSPPPVPSQAPTGRQQQQQELRHQTSSKQHVRSQSVRAPSASAAGRSGKLAGISNNNNSPSHGGGSVRVSGNNDKKTGGQNKARPRGASLPSNRAASAAAATALAAAAASSVSATTTLADTSGPADEGDEADYYLLRHFIVHGKGKKVVNRGDSFRRLRHQQQQQQQQQQQRQGSISQHSSTSSISSTENVAGSPPPGQQHPPAGQQHQQQQQAQYYSYSDHQSSSSSRRASLLGAAGAAGPSDGQQITYGIHSSSAPGVAAPDPYRVLMLGSSGVGKTALTAQFMTSEYLNTYEASLDEDSFDRSVSVLLDGEESQLIFIDHPRGEISVENCMSTYNPHAFVIVYSVVDAESLRQAEEVLHFLWRHSLTNVSTPLLAANQRQIQQQPNVTPPTTTLSPAGNTSIAQPQQQPSPVKAVPSPPQLLLPPPPPVVILVANKIDLVRSRIISPQAGKSLATSFDCKYIETSSGMQHNVDELLVGILKQIRLKIQMAEQQLINWSVSSSSSSSSTSKSLFRKRSGRRRQQQQQQRVNYNGGADQLVGAAENGSGLTEGSCCIVTNPSSTSPGSTSSVGGGGNNGGYLLSTTSNNRRSTSLRVRRMLGKAVWTCADYYHRNKSRSCEDLHVL